VRPQTDTYADDLERVIAVLLSQGVERAAEALEPIAYRPTEISKRIDPSESVIASIYQRDRFECRYCGCRVIPTQVMRLLSHFFPDSFPYHRNWKAGQTHPAVASRSATLDHVRPWTAGGTNETNNLVCACWICNRVKGELTLEQLGWPLRPVPLNSEWDGLTRFYRPLWELAGRPREGDHPLWIRLYSRE
jgi:5-methylcytosine-specific restriction endonuclease McrA